MVKGKKEYYNILKVTRDATEVEIKRSFRRLALQFHPDRAHGDSKTEEHFKEINEAYTVLSDPEKRRLYDITGSTEDRNPLWTGYMDSRRGFPGSSRCCGRGRGFGHLFARKGAGDPAYRNIYLLPLTPEEALHGVQKNITFHFKGILQRINIRTPAGLKDGSVLLVGMKDSGTSKHEIVFRVSLMK
jgi:curved DNA-binding protein